MNETFATLKRLLVGQWTGVGFAKFPTIADTAYTERLEFVADTDKEALFFQQKTWYQTIGEQNGHTVFWDAGFLILKDETIQLLSVQIGGRMETYELVGFTPNTFTFNSLAIEHDPKTIRSQRIFSVEEKKLLYELNMATHEASFQNHLKAGLTRVDQY